jgi:hypothetical protein
MVEGESQTRTRQQQQPLLPLTVHARFCDLWAAASGLRSTSAALKSRWPFRTTCVVAL